MAVAYGKLLDYELLRNPELPLDAYEGIFGGVSMDGAKNSYMYVVDQNSNMVYHPTADKIGKPVENAMIKQVIKDVESGNYKTSDVVTYEFNGSNKFASFLVLSNKNVLVVSADEDEILGNVNIIFNLAIMTVLVLLVVFAILAYVFSVLITGPIKKLTEIIAQTAAFDFRVNDKARILLKRKDETGFMARAVADMRSHLRNMVGDINTVSRKITNNVDELKLISSSINGMCTDNSATTEELAAGMQETSATTETINNSIGYMQTGADDIKTLSVDGEKTSEEIMKRAAELSETTEAAGIWTAAGATDAAGVWTTANAAGIRTAASAAGIWTAVV